MTPPPRITTKAVFGILDIFYMDTIVPIFSRSAFFKAMPAEEIAQHLGKPVGLPTIDNIKDSKVA